jgi:hypothetical protein
MWSGRELLQCSQIALRFIACFIQFHESFSSMDADEYGFRIFEEVEFYVPTIKLDHMNFDARNGVMW